MSITIKPAKNIDSTYYQSEVQEIKKSLKSFSPYYPISVEDWVDYCGNMVVEIDLGEFSTQGSLDNKTFWFNTETLPKIIKKMQSIKFIVCDFSLKKKILSLSFTKSVPKKFMI